MAYDYSKLCGRIVEKYGSRGNFAKEMELSEHSMSAKLSGKVPFKQPEISKACSLLDIPDSEIHAYFFTLDVQRA